ncbi:MAG: hypothetical protein FWF05_06090 [Oscillospiraceae bacterium]|nr:hypothetical protein [Oscillospiraceae bacterium]
MQRNCLKLRKTPQKLRTFFGPESGLPSENITALAYAADGTLFAGTGKGLCFFRDGAFIRVGGIDGAVKALHPLGDCVLASCGNILYTVTGKAVTAAQELPRDIVEICSDAKGNTWLITDESLFKYTDAGAAHYSDMELGGANAMTACGDSKVYAVSPAALEILHGKRPSWGVAAPGMSSLPTIAIRSMTADECGYVWCAAEQGLYLFDGKSEWLSPAQFSALPSCPVNKVVLGRDGSRFIATDIGLYVQRGTYYTFLTAERWLPSPKVTTVAVTDSGDEFWAGTDKGLSRVIFKYMSLEDKAKHYHYLTDTFYNRENYTTSRHIPDGIFEHGRPAISDNDGLWTAMYVAAQSFRFAVTGEAEAKEKARASMKAMLKLIDISGIEGFPARAYRRPGEHGFGDGDIEWHLTADENGELEWKGETSSDEMVGHYYAAAWYFDLVADDAEKREIADAIRKVTDHVLTHDYTLCDTDGLPTTWANWDPLALNHDDTWVWERGINSLEMLAFLKVTAHLTGDKKYDDEYDMLVKKHHFALNVVTYKIDDNHSCHIDDKLGFFSIHLLMNYEKNPQLLKYYQLGLRYHFEVELIERHPGWNFIYGGLTNEPCDVESAVRTLQEMPLDLIQYRMNNTVRPEVVIDRSPMEFGGNPQAKIPLPADERPMDRLTGGAFKLDYNGESCRSACSPTTWLLPYWTGRYYNLFEE